MARRSDSNFRPGYLLLSALIATMLWGVAHSQSTVTWPIDIPVVFENVPENLVVTKPSANVVNVRLRGSRTASRSVPEKLAYPIDVSTARPGPAVFEVDTSILNRDLPRADIVARSPSSIEVRFERRGRKSVRIRADVEGQPPAEFELLGIQVEPPRVWLAGARGDVLRLSEVVTEAIDISELTETTEREVRLSLGSGTVWMEESQPVKVRIEVAAKAPPAEDGSEAAQEEG